MVVLRPKNLFEEFENYLLISSVWRFLGGPHISQAFSVTRVPCQIVAWVGGVVWGGLIFQGLVAPTVWWATSPTCLGHAQCVHTLQGHMRGRGWKCRVVTCGRSRRQQPGTPGNGFLPPSEWKNCHQLRGVGVGVIRLLRRFQVWGCWNFISLIASVVGSAPQEAVSPAHLPEPGRGGCLAPQGVVCGCDHPGCYTASGRHCRVSTISGPSPCTAAFVEYRR